MVGTPPPAQPTPGRYPDPTGQRDSKRWRYWDGQAWHGPRVSAVCGFSDQRRGHDRQHRRRDRRKTEIAAGQPITSASLADSLASMFAAKCGNFRDTCAASRRFLRKPCGGRGRHAQRRGRRLGEYDGPGAHSDLPVQRFRAVRHPTARCRPPLHLAHRRSRVYRTALDAGLVNKVPAHQRDEASGWQEATSDFDIPLDVTRRRTESVPENVH